MATRSFVVVALAVAGASAGGLSMIGAAPGATAPPVVSVSPVNCVTDTASEGSTSIGSVLDRAEASAGRVANDDAVDGTGGSGSLAERARAGSSGSTSSPDAGQSASTGAGDEPAADELAPDELAQALADSLAGSTQPAARRLAAALADEGFVASDGTGQGDAGQDATGGATAATEVSNQQERASRDVEASCADPAAQRENTADETAATGSSAGRTAAAGTQESEPILSGGREETGEPAGRTGSGTQLGDRDADTDADTDADARAEAIESIASVLERTAAGRGAGAAG